MVGEKNVSSALPIKTEITTTCWKTIKKKKKLQPNKKDILHMKTKKPQWDGRRGTISIKSNLTLAKWVTHKLENNYITEVLPQKWKY